ncbi:ATP-binding protein [Sphingobacterium multivorum]|nr:EcoRII N-terminal effector-binding domain-containing protein [Sphingobacterium multivorum]QQT32870.1 ATP-binding protein [Sphingobacterium multivorum]
MTEELKSALNSLRDSITTFWKFVSSNDAGETGAHQAGLYMPKDSVDFMFENVGVKGENKEKFADLIWSDGTKSTCRFIYYGKGTRNEYRLTRLGKNLSEGQIVIICKKSETLYSGFILTDAEDKDLFLKYLNLGIEDSNSLIAKDYIKYINFEKINEDIDFKLGIKSEQLFFKPKAHILTLLGEELIKSPVMAIYELVKNSYDADSKNVTVTFEGVDDLAESKISIIDDGTGITEEILVNVWLEPGSAHRKPINEKGEREIFRSKIFNRVPMGEKGVGRFAVHKLGRKIVVISRPCKVVTDDKNRFLRKELLPYEVYLEIDWNTFTQSKYLEDVEIYWTKRIDKSSFLFPEDSGTFIEVSELKEYWTRGMARQLKKHALSMVSPKNDYEKFHIKLDFKNNWLDNIPDVNDILSASPYKMTALLTDDFQLTFEYDFKLANNSQIGVRKILNDKSYDKTVRGEIRPYFRNYLIGKGYENEGLENKLNMLDNLKLPFGKILIEFYSFDLDSNSIKDITYTPEVLRNILKDHHGVKVYKDDLRVFNYGEQGDDWLGLDIKRVNNKEWFSNNQNIGFVFLDSASSTSLIEKTNREGFIENENFELFKICLDFLLNIFKNERQKDRVKWLNFNKRDRSGSFDEKINSFFSLIEEAGIHDENKKQRLKDEAERLESEYEKTKENLLLPAGVGLTASVALHEIEKLIPRMKNTTQSDPIPVEKIKQEVVELDDYVNGILTILKKSVSKDIVVLDVVKNSVNNYNIKAKTRKINLEIIIDHDISTVKCDKRYLATMIMNLVDNSIYWLDTVYKSDKSILIKASKINEITHIVVVDNGPGFKDSVEDLVRPFFSRRDSGIGIGLYIIDTLMMKYGKLIFNDTEVEFDKEKYTGAVVSLVFNKNQD